MKKRADGRYCKQILIGYHPDGRRKMKTIYGTTIKEVEKKERECRNMIEKGAINTQISYLFKDFAKIWMLECKKGAAETTILRYQSILDNHTKYIDNMPLTNIKTSHLQSLINDMYDNNFRSSIKLTKTVLTQIFKYALTNDYIIKNPLVGVIIPKYQTKKKRALTTDELNAILNMQTLNDKERLFLYLGVFCGCRRGESLALTTENIDFDKNEIHINKTLQYLNNNPIIKDSTKTSAGIRIVPLIEPLKSTLKEYCENLNSNYLFLTQNKKLFTRTAFDNMWSQIRKKLSAYMNCETEITSHYLRYTYATNLYYAGIDVKMAQYLLGHNDIKTTLDIYTSLNRDNTAVINKLNTYLNSQSSKS